MTVIHFNGRHHLDRRAEALIEQANAGTDDELIDTVKTALWLGVSPQWLEIGRSRGWGPPFIKLSPRRVRYRVGAVKQWLTERSYRTTSENQGGSGRAASHEMPRAVPAAENGIAPPARALGAPEATEKPRRPRVRLDPNDFPPARTKKMRLVEV